MQGKQGLFVGNLSSFSKSYSFGTTSIKGSWIRTLQLSSLIDPRMVLEQGSLG